MPTRAQQLANNPLNGSELRTVVVSKVDTILSEIREQVIERLTAEAERSGLFITQYCHPRVRFSLSAKFQWANQNLPKTELSVIAGEGKPSQVEADSQIVIGVEETHTIENPNIERLDAKIPFTRTDTTKAKPGEVFGKVQTIEIPVDPVEYANVPRSVPEVADSSAELATSLKVSKEKLLPKRR